MKVEDKFKKINIFFFSILSIFLLYSFDYSLGWGMNLMFPDIYLFTFGKGNSGYHPFIWNESGIVETLQVLLLFFSISKFSIFNEIGQVVISKINTGINQTIDISNLKSGVYLLVVKSDNTTSISRLVKK